MPRIAVTYLYTYLPTHPLGQTGRVFTWGLGKDGRLGHGNQRKYLRPALVQVGAGAIFHFKTVARVVISRETSGAGFYPRSILAPQALETTQITQVRDCGGVAP